MGKILLKRGTGIYENPTLDSGEMAINTQDGVVFFGVDDANSPLAINGHAGQDDFSYGGYFMPRIWQDDDTPYSEATFYLTANNPTPASITQFILAYAPGKIDESAFIDFIQSNDYLIFESSYDIRQRLIFKVTSISTDGTDATIVVTFVAQPDTWFVSANVTTMYQLLVKIYVVKDIETRILKPRSSAPSNPTEGMEYVDSTTHHKYCYLNGAWKQLDN